MEPSIEFQGQHLDNNCASTVMAMILKRDVRQVTIDFHHAYLTGRDELELYLTRAGVKFEHCYTSCTDLEKGNAYIIVVPSMNEIGSLHVMVIEVAPNGGWWIFDPQEGNTRGHIVYSTYNKGVDIPDGYAQLKGWIPEFKFKVEDLKQFWRDQNEN